MAEYKKLTLLHSNDLHGDFTVQKVNDKDVGGVSMLSGYIDRVRKEEENVLYTISGDMFQGSLIDSEYKGISTIEIVNMLAPDVVTLGNHEVDYGLAHLLFLEKCANFPIINANLYLRNNYKRLFKSHLIKKIGGMKIMFIGILTEDVLASTRNEDLIGAMVDIREAAAEVGKICDAYQTEDIDLTVLLTHIGFEADKKLAELLDERWGVDLILGGHSHTYLTEPAVVNGIPIVQAASGTDQIGRFDLIINTDTNSIQSYTWTLVPITRDTCPIDEALKEVIYKYKDETDQKYALPLVRLDQVYTHPARNQETMLGHLVADAFREQTRLDIVLIASGAIRKKEEGPIITKKDLLEMYPYNSEMFRIVVTGAQFKRMMEFMMREEAFMTGDHTEFYQPSYGLEVYFSRKDHKVHDLKLDGKEIADDRRLTVGLERYHFHNLPNSFGITIEEVRKNRQPKVIITRCTDVLEEYLSNHDYLEVSTDQRYFIERPNLSDII